MINDSVKNSKFENMNNSFSIDLEDSKCQAFRRRQNPNLETEGFEEGSAGSNNHSLEVFLNDQVEAIKDLMARDCSQDFEDEKDDLEEIPSARERFFDVEDAVQLRRDFGVTQEGDNKETVSDAKSPDFQVNRENAEEDEGAPDENE